MEKEAQKIPITMTIRKYIKEVERSGQVVEKLVESGLINREFEPVIKDALYNGDEVTITLNPGDHLP